MISQEDLADYSLLQRKIQVPDKPVPATAIRKKNLLTLTARLLSHQSLLHVGYREIKDMENLVTQRHKHSLQTVDGKILHRLEICQMFYTTRFSGQKFYTVKTRILRLFLLTIKQRRCHYQLVLSFFFVEIEMNM